MYLCVRRFETLEPEMNNLGTRISDVNQVAQQLLGSDNRSKEQIHQTQDQLNNRLVVLNMMPLRHANTQPRTSTFI